MKSLSCVVIGDRSVIVVVIDALKKVALLKDMIKKKKMYDFPADQLELYVTKKDSAWLTLNDPDVQRLENGETPHGITALINDTSNKMDPTWNIGDAEFGFPDESGAARGKIHVLVVIPLHVTGAHYKRTLLYC
ncbi:hypothetical protein V7S43_000012 [Phytophthora oleae]|uniref:Crinkler effector protein N-terminal domain-containing protein n=1 Tax=Phytophthora oleae TaxID=2107226 RepID=A0ABD3G7S2_9STRA